MRDIRCDAQVTIPSLYFIQVMKGYQIHGIHVAVLSHQLIQQGGKTNEIDDFHAERGLAILSHD